MQPGMASKVEMLTGGYCIAVSLSAIGRAERRVTGRYSHRAADAVVVLDSPDCRAVATQRGERDSILLGKRALKTQPYGERVVGVRLASWARSFLDCLLAQFSPELFIAPFLRVTAGRKRAGP